MAKYDPLRNYLRRQRNDEIELSFAEIERLLGAMLPNRASLPQWWAIATKPYAAHPQSNAWKDAGFDASLIARRDRVRFRRVVP